MANECTFIIIITDVSLYLDIVIWWISQFTGRKYDLAKLMKEYVEFMANI